MCDSMRVIATSKIKGIDFPKIFSFKATIVIFKKFHTKILYNNVVGDILHFHGYVVVLLKIAFFEPITLLENCLVNLVHGISYLILHRTGSNSILSKMKF